jgi:hypothetical protein
MGPFMTAEADPAVTARSPNARFGPKAFELLNKKASSPLPEIIVP